MGHSEDTKEEVKRLRGLLAARDAEIAKLKDTIVYAEKDGVSYRAEIERLTKELNGFKTLATELTKGRDEWKDTSVIKDTTILNLHDSIQGVRGELANERKAVEWAADNLVWVDAEDMIMTADEIRKKAREEK